MEATIHESNASFDKHIQEVCRCQTLMLSSTAENEPDEYFDRITDPHWLSLSLTDALTIVRALPTSSGGIDSSGFAYIQPDQLFVVCRVDRIDNEQTFTQPSRLIGRNTRHLRDKHIRTAFNSHPSPKYRRRLRFMYYQD